MCMAPGPKQFLHDVAMWEMWANKRRWCTVKIIAYPPKKCVTSNKTKNDLEFHIPPTPWSALKLIFPGTVNCMNSTPTYVSRLFSFFTVCFPCHHIFHSFLWNAVPLPPAKQKNIRNEMQYLMWIYRGEMWLMWSRVGRTEMLSVVIVVLFCLSLFFSFRCWQMTKAKVENSSLEAILKLMKWLNDNWAKEKAKACGKVSLFNFAFSFISRERTL